MTFISNGIRILQSITHHIPERKENICVRMFQITSKESLPIQRMCHLFETASLRYWESSFGMQRLAVSQFSVFHMSFPKTTNYT